MDKAEACLVILKDSEVVEAINTVKEACYTMNNLITALDLPQAKPRVAHNTDAGPGVGVSNTEVRCRDAELSMIEGSDYRVRIHRARGDSGQNEAERTNSASGDAIVDGSTINWEFYSRFDGMSDEQVKALNMTEFEKYEHERMSKNAWRVAHEIANRIDGSPVLSDYTNSYVAEDITSQFFFCK